MEGETHIFLFQINSRAKQTGPVRFLGLLVALQAMFAVR